MAIVRSLNRIDPFAFKYRNQLVTIGLLLQVGLILYWRVARGYWPIDPYESWEGLAPGWAQSLYTWRWLVRILQVGLLIGLGLLEWRAAAVSTWLQSVLQTRRRQLGLLAGLAVALLTYFFQPGNIATGDAYGHIPSAWVVRQAWQEGWWFVFWSNFTHLGGPTFQFHNSAYYYLVALVSYVVPDFSDANELTLFILYSISLCGFFLFLHELSSSKRVAFWGTLAWGATFFHYHVAVELARLPTAMFMAGLPFQFFLTEKLLRARGDRLRWLAGLALTLGLLIWVHALYGSISIGIAILFGILHGLNLRGLNLSIQLQRIGLVTLACGLALFIAMYQVVPLIAEWGLLSPNTSSQLNNLPPNDLTLAMVLDPASWRGGFIGNSILLIGCLSGLVVAALRYRRAYSISLLLFVLILIQFDPGPTWISQILGYVPLGRSLARVIYYRPEAYLMFSVVCVAALFGWASHLLTLLWRLYQHKTGRRWKILGLPERMSLVLGAVVLVEILPLTWNNHKRPDIYVEEVPNLGQLYEVLAQRPDVTRRVINLQTGSNPSFMIPMLTGHPSLFGHAQDDPPATVATLHKILTLATQTARQRTLNVDAAGLFKQTNIGYLITDSTVPEIAGLTRLASTDYSTLWQVPGGEPLVIVDRQTGELWSDSTDILTIRSNSETNDTATVQYTLKQSAFLQLAYSAYPDQVVALDGQSIANSPTPLGLIGFESTAGDHTVTIMSGLSLVRRVCLLTSVSATLAVMVIGFWARLSPCRTS